jgi:hypothetical protein
MNPPYPFPYRFGTPAANGETPSSSGGGFGAADWASVLAGITNGASSAMKYQPTSGMATNSREAREAKRRTLSQLLNQALTRNQGLFRVGQQHGGEGADTKSQALQNAARGFIGSLQGSTG